MHRRLLLGLLALAACRPAVPTSGPGDPDPDPADPVALLQAYLRIDTTNPPGRELAAARFLHRLLEREGIESEVLELGGGRANLRAILRGDGSRRPVVLLHHLDVVPADARHWRRAPPFSGRIVEGEVIGRGAVDIKGKGAIDLATLVAFKRRGQRLHRDLILLGVADEENNSLGARAVVERRPDLIRGAEYLIDEGVSVRVDGKRRPLAYLVSVGEKAPLWLTLRFAGRPGHGSVPRPGSAVERAIRAGARILAWRRPVQLLPDLRAWVKLEAQGHDLGAVLPSGVALEAALEQPALLEAIADRVPEVNAAVRDTIALTGLQGSEKVNVIPNQALLRLDCRLLPGHDAKSFLAGLRAAIDDPSVAITIDEHYTTSSSPTRGPFLDALAAVAARLDRGAPVVPTILRSSTDSSSFRKLGIHAYGFEPYRLTEAESSLAHANDERLSVRNLRDGVTILRELLLELDRR